MIVGAALEDSPPHPGHDRASTAKCQDPVDCNELSSVLGAAVDEEPHDVGVGMAPYLSYRLNSFKGV